VKVLEERQAEAFANFVTDGQKQQASAIPTELSHRGGHGRGPREQKVGFTFSFFRIKEAYRAPVFERLHGFANTLLHDSP
jgi:hypothetical protein